MTKSGQREAIAKLKKKKFEAPDKELLQFAKDALARYVNDVINDPDLVKDVRLNDDANLSDAEIRNDARRGLECAVKPLETVFIAYRQHLRRCKIADAAENLRGLLSPFVENEKKVIDALDALDDADHKARRNLTLQTFVIRRTADTLAKWEAGWKCTDYKMGKDRSPHVGGIASDLLGVPISASAVSKALTNTPWQKKYQH